MSHELVAEQLVVWEGNALCEVVRMPRHSVLVMSVGV